MFFLDLPGHKCLEAISNKLTQRGATVEKCFHRGVKYLVTNRHKTGNKMGMACMTPSPDTPENEVGIASPFSNSSNSAKPVSHGTRRAKILAASVSIPYFKSGLIGCVLGGLVVQFTKLSTSKNIN